MSQSSSVADNFSGFLEPAGDVTPVEPPPNRFDFGALASVLEKPQPVKGLMERFAETLSEHFKCNLCGLATRTTQEEVLFQKLARRQANGSWANWLVVTSRADDGGALTQAVRSRRAPLVVADLQGIAALRDEALMSAGVVSAVVVPLRSTQSDYGTLGIYHDFPRPFAKADVQFVEIAGKMLTLAIERSCLEFNLRTTTQLQTALLQSPCLLYVLLRPDGAILNANRGLLDLIGCPADQVQGRSLGDWIEVAYEFATLATIINQTRSGPVQIEATLRTQGDPRRINWTFRKSDMPDGQWQCLVTGFDITAQNAAVERALSAERDLEHLREALAVIQRATDVGDLAEISRTLGKMGLAARLETPPATPVGGQADTRVHERHSFHSAQQIAPIVDGETPRMEEFITVTCLDLSVGGISFLLTAPPTAREYVVLLGTQPNYLHIRAEVRNCRPYQLADQEYFRIGCRFTDRVRQLP